MPDYAYKSQLQVTVSKVCSKIIASILAVLSSSLKFEELIVVSTISGLLSVEPGS